MPWGAIASIGGALLSANSSSDAADASRANANTAAQAANPHLGFQTNTILPEIRRLLSLGSNGPTNYNNINSQIPGVLAEIMNRMKNPNNGAQRLRDIGISNASDYETNPMGNKAYRESEGYADLIKKFISDPGSFGRTPGAQASFDSGTEAMLRSGARNHLNNSGNILTDLQKMGQQNYASSYQEQMSTLMNLMSQRRNMGELDYKNAITAATTGDQLNANKYQDLTNGLLPALSGLGAIGAGGDDAVLKRLAALMPVVGGSPGSAANAQLVGGTQGIKYDQLATGNLLNAGNSLANLFKQQPQQNQYDATPTTGLRSENSFDDGSMSAALRNYQGQQTPTMAVG